MNNNFVPIRKRKEKEDIKGKRKEESEEQLKEQLRIYEKELREKILSDYEKNANFKKIFDEIKKIANIKILHPHRLRHTYASKMIEQWIDIAVVKEQMWHTNIATTNRYIAVRDSHRKKVIQKLWF